MWLDQMTTSSWLGAECHKRTLMLWWVLLRTIQHFIKNAVGEGSSAQWRIKCLLPWKHLAQSYQECPIQACKMLLALGEAPTQITSGGLQKSYKTGKMNESAGHQGEKGKQWCNKWRTHATCQIALDSLMALSSLLHSVLKQWMPLTAKAEALAHNQWCWDL